jgi:hypothetical protein
VLSPFNIITMEKAPLSLREIIHSRMTMCHTMIIGLSMLHLVIEMCIVATVPMSKTRVIGMMCFANINVIVSASFMQMKSVILYTFYIQIYTCSYLLVMMAELVVPCLIVGFVMYLSFCYMLNFVQLRGQKQLIIDECNHFCV